MKTKLLLTVLLFVSACSSTSLVTDEKAGAAAKSQPANQTSQSGSTASQRRFENAIAAKLLADLTENLRFQPEETHPDILQRSLQQFRRSVDINQLTSTSRLEYELLVYLSEQRKLNTGNPFEYRIQQLTSMNRSLSQHEASLKRELERLNQTIAVLASTNPVDFDLARHMKTVRSQAVVPENSVSGRQAYLDRISTSLFESQLNWPDVLLKYQPAELSVLGTTQAAGTFLMDRDVLRIDLTDVRDLPEFELKPVASYFGYPGQQSLRPPGNQSLRSYLELPAYTMGWAGYITDYLGTRDVDHTLNYLYFSKTMTALGYADLKIHNPAEGKWTRQQVHEYLLRETPYSSHRLELMINNVVATPGYYLAGAVGKLAFSELHQYCLVTQGDCDSQFHQRIVDLGPVPFSLLKPRI